MDFLYFVLTIGAAVTYAKKRYFTFVLLLFTILSNVWGICPTGIIQVHDWMFLTTVLSVAIGWHRSKRFFSVKEDYVGKLVIILVCYVFVAALLSPIRGVESLGFSLMVARFDVFYLLYFVFRQIPISVLKKSVKPIVYLSVFNGVLYYLQYFGISLLANMDASDMAGVENARFNNIPVFTIMLFFLFFLLRGRGSRKFLLMIFFGGIIVGSQNRAMILAVALSVVVFVILSYKKNIVEKKTIVGLVIIGCLSSGVLAYRFSEEGSTGGGIVSELKLGYEMSQNRGWRFYDSQMMYSEGTLAFRIGMILEKVNYLVDRPISLLIGAGSYHESSMSTHYLPFVFGSNSTNGRAKVDTDDVALLSRLFRYGILFIGVYILFIVRTIKLSRINQQSFLSNLYFMVIVCYIGWAICGDVFHRPQNFIPVLLLISQLLKESKYENENSVFLS